jgi:hypothetical protein
MAGPWEKYGPPVESGPWDKYKSGPAQVDAGGKTFGFQDAENAAGFQRELEGSRVNPDVLAMQYGGRPVEALPPPRQPAPPAGFLTGLGRSAAGLADTTIGGVIPGLTQQFGYPIARTFMPAEKAASFMGDVTSATERPFGRAFGVTETPEYKNEASQRLTQFIGENIDKGAQWLSEKTGLPATDITNMMGSASFLAGPAVAKIPAKLGERQADRAIAASNKSWEDLPRIEAAQAAQRHGILLSPADSNPGKFNTFVGALAGGKAVSEGLAKQNIPKWTRLAKEDMGLPPNTVLEPAAFERARQMHSAPYDRIQGLGRIDADEQFFADLDNIGGAEILGRSPSDPVAKLVGQLSERALSPLDGGTILRSIQEYRKTAQDIYKRDNTSQPPSALERAEADASMRVADALEELAVRNVYDPKFKAELQAARTAMAKTYAYQRAVDGNTKKIDPNVIAKMVEADPGRYTGILKDIGNVAGIFPDIAAIKESNVGVAPRLYRSTPSVLMGTAIGTAAGTTGLVGAGIGAGVGALGSYFLRQGAASPAVQRRFAVPSDNRLRVPEPEQGAPVINNLPVVYDWRNTVMDERMMPPDVAGPPSPQPSFTMGTGDLQQRTRFSPETGESVYYGPRRQPVEDVPPSGYFRQPPQPGPVNPMWPEPPVSGGYARGAAEFSPPPPAGPQLTYDLTGLSSEQLRAYEMARDANAERVNALNPTFGPYTPPTTGGVNLQFDPFINKLRPEQPSGAALPPQNELAVAVGKISRGERATLSATEKIAWDKAQADLSIVDPAYRSLTPDEVANRMSDRKSVEAAVQKAREKAAGFDEIARRAKDRDAVMLANANRERMLDFAEDLEDRLRAMPAVKLGQGPKTRAAKTLPPVIIKATRLPPEE